MNQKGNILFIALIAGILLLALLGAYTILSRNPNLPVSGMQGFFTSALGGGLILLGGGVLSLIAVFILLGLFFRLIFGAKKDPFRKLSRSKFPSLARKKIKSIYGDF